MYRHLGNVAFVLEFEGAGGDTLAGNEKWNDKRNVVQMAKRKNIGLRGLSREQRRFF